MKINSARDNPDAGARRRHAEIAPCNPWNARARPGLHGREVLCHEGLTRKGVSNGSALSCRWPTWLPDPERPYTSHTISAQQSQQPSRSAAAPVRRHPTSSIGVPMRSVVDIVEFESHDRPTRRLLRGITAPGPAPDRSRNLLGAKRSSGRIRDRCKTPWPSPSLETRSRRWQLAAIRLLRGLPSKGYP